MKIEKHLLDTIKRGVEEAGAWPCAHANENEEPLAKQDYISQAQKQPTLTHTLAHLLGYCVSEQFMRVNNRSAITQTR